MKRSGSLLMVLLGIVLLMTACAPVNTASAGSGTSDEVDSAPDDVEMSLESVQSGTRVKLSYNLNESIRIEISGTNQVVTIDRDRWVPFAKGNVYWVRDNGEILKLADAVRASIGTPIEGTVRIFEKDGQRILEVYKDPSLIPSP